MHAERLIETRRLFYLLNHELISLLTSLSKSEWEMPTIAKLWTVKDIAAHLLDTNLRGLSFSRDHYFGEPAPALDTYADLVSYLNGLNMRFTHAAKGISPQLLTDLLAITSQQYADHLNTLDPFDQAVFSVAWAGQNESPNWFHIAREYTEKFLHQQQIRDAVGKQGILTYELFNPFIHTLLMGLPFTFRAIQPMEEKAIHIHINTAAGGDWYLLYQSQQWVLATSFEGRVHAAVELNPTTAWKLFSKGISPTEAMQSCIIRGEQTLGEQVFSLVAVMA